MILDLNIFFLQIIFMEKNRIKASGTLSEIESQSPEILMQWNTDIAKESAPESQFSPGRTARERWRLFKNVTKLGLQRTNTVEDDSFNTLVSAKSGLSSV